MGILRTREEYLPVTCAVLKDEDRQAFFSAARKKAGGDSRLAAACQVPPELVSDWASGKSNIPYHSLQMLTHQFDLQMPPVGELRREYQAITHAAPEPRRKSRDARPEKPAKSEPKARKEPRARKPRREKAAPETRKPRQRKERAPRQERPPRPPRQEQPQRQKAPKQEPRGQKPAEGHGKKPSEPLAYWVGALL